MINVSFLTHKPFLSFWYIVRGGGNIFPQNNIDSTLKTDAIFQFLRFEDSFENTHTRLGRKSSNDFKHLPINLNYSQK
jgi:hypothetical protein